MVKQITKRKIVFTEEHISNKHLVINMLSFENDYGKSEYIQQMYQNELCFPRNSLMLIYSIHRHVLDHFNFDTSDESVENYRKIFKHYYKSPTEYDVDVLSSVYYMKHNKCVYYDKKKLDIGEKIINCDLLSINGKTISLYDAINKEEYSYAFFGAFSNS
jgi:hypothetical protein